MSGCLTAIRIFLFQKCTNDFIFPISGQTLGVCWSYGSGIGDGLSLSANTGKRLRAKRRTGVWFLCIGVSSMIFTHCFMNIGMVLKVMPVIGVPLPFLSAGGTSTLSMYIAIGMVIECSYTQRAEYNVSMTTTNPTLARVGR